MRKPSVTEALTCLAVTCLAAAASPKCPESELAEIEYGVKTCQKQAEARFFLSPDSVRLCQLLVEVQKRFAKYRDGL